MTSTYEEQDRPQFYQITVEGHLNPNWSGWFDDLRLTHQEDGTTLLSGLVRDQAALHGLLIKIRDLSLTLLSVNRKENFSPEDLVNDPLALNNSTDDSTKS